MCGCRYAAVCRHCVPNAFPTVPPCLCAIEEWRFHVGSYVLASDNTHTTSHERK